jgi:hypothetical protein
MNFTIFSITKHSPEGEYTEPMKNLNLFLWIFTTAITIYFAYHTYTHTRIRYKDLESVMMQNLAVEKGIATIKRNTRKEFENAQIRAEKDGNISRDMFFLQKATNIRQYTETVLETVNNSVLVKNTLVLDKKVNIDVSKIDLISPFYINFPQFVATRDTLLQDLSSPIISLLDTKNHYFPLFQQRNLRLSYVILRIENKSIDKLVAGVGGRGMRFEKIIAMASAKSQVVKVGNNYEAQIFITPNATQIKPQMQISEGKVIVRGDVGEIEIKNVKAQNYNSEGKATKTLTGKITIKKADENDTTFTLSTSYTIKKLVN